MILAKVIGTVVSTRKEESVRGLKFLMVRPVDLDGNETGSIVVAADAVGAGKADVIPGQTFGCGSSLHHCLASKLAGCGFFCNKVELFDAIAARDSATAEP